MFTSEVLERFKNPVNAGGLRGANGTGKAGDVELGEIIKIYILVNEDGIIETARFKAYGGVVTIAGCDYACDLLIGGNIEDAFKITSDDILEKLGSVPENREYVLTLIEEAIKNSIEDYYKKKDKEEN